MNKALAASDVPDPSIRHSLDQDPRHLSAEDLAAEIGWHEARLAQLRRQLKARTAGQASGRARATHRKFDPVLIVAIYRKKKAEKPYGAHKETCAQCGCSPATLSRFLKLIPPPRP